MNVGLRTQILTVFVVAVVFVTAVITAVSIHNTNVELRESIAREQEESVRGLAASISILSDSMDRTLAATASLIPPDDLSPRLNEPSVRPLLDSIISESPAVDAVLLVNREGDPVMTRPPAHPVTAQDITENPAFHQARDSGQSAHSFSNALESPLWVRPLSATLESDDPHYLAATLNLNQARDLLLNHGLTHTEVALMGPDGLVVATAGEAYDDGTEKGLSLTSADGMVDTGERFVTTGAVSDSDAVILISGSKTPLRMAQWEVAVQSIILAASLSLAAVLVGIWASRRLTRPLSHLESTARLMGKGHLHARAVPTGPPEVKNLALTLNQMAADLGRERQDLLDLQGELESLVEERTGQLVARRQAMEQFFYGASHDIKSPVVAITALSEMAQEELQDADLDKQELGDLLGRIEESSGRLKYFVDELLHFAQAESLTPVITTVDLCDISRSAVRELEPAAAGKGIALWTVGGPLAVRTDGEEVRQILVNLIQNAVKYMPTHCKDPSIRVYWDIRDEHAELVVQDNGAGIPSDVRDSLFQPFTHSTHGEHPSDGAGLGLSIVKRIADALQITVTLETPSGGGARFRLTFPPIALIKQGEPQMDTTPLTTIEEEKSMTTMKAKKVND